MFGLTKTTAIPTSTTTVKPTSKKLTTASLPDEVPDDLRQQLLSSGILENADISVLDYDKVGDIPLEVGQKVTLVKIFNASALMSHDPRRRITFKMH